MIRSIPSPGHFPRASPLVLSSLAPPGLDWLRRNRHFKITLFSWDSTTIGTESRGMRVSRCPRSASIAMTSKGYPLKYRCRHKIFGTAWRRDRHLHGWQVASLFQ
jgi:hypothetical protein